MSSLSHVCRWVLAVTTLFTAALLYAEDSVVQPAPKSREIAIFNTRTSDTPRASTHRVPVYFDASHLLIDVSSMREDLAILKYLREIDASHPADDQPQQPIVVISGGLGGRVSATRSYAGVNSADVDLSSATLDVFGTVTPWAFGFMSFDYDSSNPSNSTRVANSNVNLARAFITAGDLSHSPNYLTIGQFYMPFGFHKTFMLGNQLTKSIGRVLQRGMVWGYVQPHWSTEVFVFSGETDVGSNGIDQGGASINHTFTQGDWHWDVGTGFITQMAEATLFQDTGQSSGFQGFSKADADEILAHRVPAWAGHVALTRGEDWGAHLEWVTALRSFDSADLSYNGAGARPAAVHLEGIMHRHLKSLPVSYAAVYAHSWESLAVSLPRDTLALVFSTSWWRDTTFGVEYRWDHNYGSGDSATGNGQTVTRAGSVKQSLIADFVIRF